MTNATAHWYWNDLAPGPTSEKVTCTATVTPLSGQGSPFSIAVTQPVLVNDPTTSESDAAGITRIDKLDTAFPGSYSLWAGPSTAVKNGSQWVDSLTTPSLFPPQPNNAGAWAHLQLITTSGTATAVPGGTSKSLGTGVASLDGGFPYGAGYFPDSGSARPEGDSPGLGLDDNYTEFTPNYSFDQYVMYAPPGVDTIFVPITKLHWTWVADDVKPGTALTGHWSSWPVAAVPNGTVTVPKSGTPCNTEPKWTSIVVGFH